MELDPPWLHTQLLKFRRTRSLLWLAASKIEPRQHNWPHYNVATEATAKNVYAPRFVTQAQCLLEETNLEAALMYERVSAAVAIPKSNLLSR